ncbi:MAG: flagellar export protein FliJ [Deltaproteobacteria bacterium]|nr:flagellar export protein FliJ [Deltaproteobacteria bacterium]
MAVFKFRLEFLISLRRRREEEAAVRLAKRQASIRELEARIDAFHDELAAMAAEISERGRAGTLSGPLLSLFSAHQERLRREIKKALELLALSRREEAKERLALEKAVKDRQIMEKIKEKRQLAWRAELLGKEQGELEELAALTKARTLREEGQA